MSNEVHEVDERQAVACHQSDRTDKACEVRKRGFSGKARKSVRPFRRAYGQMALG